MSKKFQFIVVCLLLPILLLCGLNLALLDGLQKKIGEQPAPLGASPMGKDETKPRRSMFSWEEEPYLPQTRPSLYTVLDMLEITAFYQSFSDENLYSGDTQSFLFQSGKLGREVYYLAGDKTWGLEEDAASLLAVVNKVASYNLACEDGAAFRGLVFDVEPYLTNEWDRDEAHVMQTYVNAMKKAYDAAVFRELEVVLCIPSWYDSSFPEQLDVLVSQCCDRVAVMNYNRKAEEESIKGEAALAKKYGKPIECIFEFQKPGVHQLTENETYYNAGIAASQASFETLYKNINYSEMSLSYHYYKPITLLLGL